MNSIASRTQHPHDSRRAIPSVDLTDGVDLAHEFAVDVDAKLEFFAGHGSGSDSERLANLGPVMKGIQSLHRDLGRNRYGRALRDRDHASAKPVFYVLAADITANRRCQCGGAATELIDGFLDSGFLGHEGRLLQSSLQDSTQTRLRASPSKSLAMKTIGEQAKEYRESRGWSTKEMAAACKTSRQNIETLEAKGARTPRYIKELARVMGTTVDVLMEGRYKSDAASAPEKPAAPQQAQKNQLDTDELLTAIHVIAKAIAEADELTRVSVEPLIALLAKHPEKVSNIAHRINDLLMKATPETPTSHHEGTLRRFAVDTTGWNEDGTSNRVAPKRRSAK